MTEKVLSGCIRIEGVETKGLGVISELVLEEGVVFVTRSPLSPSRSSLEPLADVFALF